MSSYQTSFIKGHLVPLPEIKHKADIAPLISGGTGCIVEYPHFSCVISKSRRLPFFSACNIDGATTADIIRTGDFVLDPKISEEHQTADSFYAIYNNKFDKGHMTKYDDVMWGATDAKTLKSFGAGTFHYTNSAPQFNTLNRGIWNSLEQYILDTEADQLSL